MTLPLAGKPLRYRIGADDAPAIPGCVVEAPYDVRPPVDGIWYFNTLDQRDSYDKETNTGEYAPYLPRIGTAEEYGEGIVDPRGAGWIPHINEQLGKAPRGDQCEWDNIDAHSDDVVLDLFDRTRAVGLGIWVKNPGSRVVLIAHPSAVGIIQEYDKEVTAAKLQALRIAKPGLSIRVVTFGLGQIAWATDIASEARAAGYPDFGVTHDSHPDEYGGNIKDVLIPTGPTTMAWRVANSLLTLRDQVNKQWPNRDKSSDGTIGDASHAATTSDHNPNSAGVVTAMDITHDPAHGLDARKLAEALVASRDPRIKYIISNAQIISSSVSAWQWRPYSGVNAHRHHCHISVAGNYDDTKPWHLEPVTIFDPPPPAGKKRQTKITATVWDDAMGAYGPIDHSKPSVSLPAPFSAPRPMVRVIGPRGTAEGPITDKGPWYDGTIARPADFYWETGARPRAESDPHTNGAGIDLNPAMAAAVGIDGKGKVDWEFVGAVDKPIDIDPDDIILPDKTQGSQTMLLLLMLILLLIKEKSSMATVPGAPNLDIQKLLPLLLQAFGQQAAPPPPPPPPPPPTDTAALLAALIAGLTGKPVEKPAELPPKPVEPPVTPPAIEKPSVQLSAVGGAFAWIAQLLGWLPPPVDMTTGTTSTAGLLTTVLPIIAAVVASTGAFGTAGSFLSAIFGAFQKK